MPVYRFKCSECNCEFSGTYKYNETKVECPECKSHETERLISKGIGITYVGKGYTKAMKKAKKAAKEVVEGNNGG